MVKRHLLLWILGRVLPSSHVNGALESRQSNHHVCVRTRLNFFQLSLVKALRLTLAASSGASSSCSQQRPSTQAPCSPTASSWASLKPPLHRVSPLSYQCGTSVPNSPSATQHGSSETHAPVYSAVFSPMVSAM